MTLPYGLKLEYAAIINIRDVRFENLDSSLILYESDFVKIKTCWFREIQQYGIIQVVESATDEDEYGLTTDISDNRISSTGLVEGTVGIKLTEGASLYVKGNEFNGLDTAMKIGAWRGTPPPSGNFPLRNPSVVYNKFESIADHDIYLGEGTGHVLGGTIAGNHFISSINNHVFVYVDYVTNNLSYHSNTITCSVAYTEIFKDGSGNNDIDILKDMSGRVQNQFKKQNGLWKFGYYNNADAIPGYTSETAALELGFGNTAGQPVEGIQLLAGKENDFTTTNARDAYFGVKVLENDVLMERFRVKSNGDVKVDNLQGNGDRHVCADVNGVLKICP